MAAESDHVRDFLAIEIEEAARGRIHQLAQRLRQSGLKATWVKSGNVHLTLRFLGNYPCESMPLLIDTLATCYEGVTAFAADIRGVGLFPNLRKPRVIWTGVEGADAQLNEIHQTTEAALRALGFPPDDKPFRPHLTIARIREGKKPSALLAPMLEREYAFDGGAIRVAGVSLFQSTLTPYGPNYNRLREFIFR